MLKTVLSEHIKLSIPKWTGERKSAGGTPNSVGKGVSVQGQLCKTAVT